MMPSNPAPERSREIERTAWFTDEVPRHGASVRSCLTPSFPLGRPEGDVLLPASCLPAGKARALQPIGLARAFLFRAARTVADEVARRLRASPSEPLPWRDEPPLSAAEAAARREGVRLLAEAIARLPARSREVFILHRIHGLSRKETAVRLGLPDRVVAAHAAQAAQRCAEFLQRRGASGFFDDETE